MMIAGRSRWSRSLGAAVLGAFALIAGTAAEARRLAVVVGNDIYPTLKPEQQLQRAVADARAVSRKLVSMGFEVETVENANLRTLDRLLTATAVRSGPGDTVLLFFAGHGLSIRGQNFLLPSDTDPEGMINELAAAETLRREAFLVDDVIERLRANGAGNVVLVLDACRNNPFRTNEGRSIGATRGLARQETPQGVFLLFSAGFGEERLDRLPGDDPEPNSVFTRTLLPLLGRPGLTLTDLAKEVQVGVTTLAARAGRTQTPAYYDQIVGRLSLVPTSPDPVAAAPPAPPAAGIKAPTPERGLFDMYSPQRRPSDVISEKNRAQSLSDFALGVIPLDQDTKPPGPKPQESGGDAGEPCTWTWWAGCLPARQPSPQQLAALDTTTPEPDAPRDDRMLARRAQLALNRLGCEAGDADGAWGQASQAALDRFARAAGRPAGEGLSVGLVETLEQRQGTMCSPTCAPTESPGSITGNDRLDGRCVAANPAAAKAPDRFVGNTLQMHYTFSFYHCFKGTKNCYPGPHRIIIYLNVYFVLNGKLYDYRFDKLGREMESGVPLPSGTDFTQWDLAGSIAKYSMTSTQGRIEITFNLVQGRCAAIIKIHGFDERVINGVQRSRVTFPEQRSFCRVRPGRVER